MRCGLLELVQIGQTAAVSVRLANRGHVGQGIQNAFWLASHTHHYVSDIIGDNRPIGIPEQVHLDVT